MTQRSEPQAIFGRTAFAGRTAVVAGAGSGIGRATAEMLAAHGCAVVVLDRDSGSAEEARDAIAAAGGTAHAVCADVTSAASVATAVAAIGGWRTGVDWLVNCVGIVVGGALVDTPEEDWRRNFAVNVDGALLLCRALQPVLARSDAAAIVNIASLAGRTAYPGGGGYGPSKAALISLSHQMAIEWAPLGIRVNVVAPGTTLTPLIRQVHSPESIARRASATPLGRLVEPGEVAAAACFLVSQAASAITAQCLDVDCGMSQALVRPAT